MRYDTYIYVVRRLKVKVLCNIGSEVFLSLAAHISPSARWQIVEMYKQPLFYAPLGLTGSS